MVPINAAIGNAIFDYITLERPVVERDTVFVRRSRPHNEFAELGGVINKVFKIAGIRTDGGTKGVRTMRHHLVTYMLKSGIDCTTVSSMVGHKDGKSLVPYVDADTEHLKECAISVEQYPVNPKIFAL